MRASRHCRYYRYYTCRWGWSTMRASRYWRDLLVVSVPPVNRSRAHTRVWPGSGIRNNRNRNRNLFWSEGRMP